MEQPLTKALATLAADAQSVALDDSAGLALFDFDEDGHDGHGTKDKHNDHGGHGGLACVHMVPLPSNLM